MSDEKNPAVPATSFVSSLSFSGAVVSPPVEEAPAFQPIAPAPGSTVQLDLARPWPLGVPSGKDALAALLGRGDVSPELEATHLSVLNTFPEWLFDEVRSTVGTTPSDVALAAGTAWRALVARGGLDAALAVDVPSVVALTDELVAARGVLAAASSFALDGGESTKDLISSLDECIGRFVVLARHQQKKRSGFIGDGTKVLAMGDGDPTKKVLPFITAVVVIGTLLFHFVNWVREPRAEEWVVVGDTSVGSAVLAPGTANASQDGFQLKLASLRSSGFEVTFRGDGQWNVRKVQ
ncbi:MAG: hypothetical protein U0228_09670 [Myxococcaceae bacterium]